MFVFVCVCADYFYLAHLITASSTVLVFISAQQIMPRTMHPTRDGKKMVEGREAYLNTPIFTAYSNLLENSSMSSVGLVAPRTSDIRKAGVLGKKEGRPAVCDISSASENPGGDTPPSSVCNSNV